MRQNGRVWRFVVALLLVVGLYRLTLLDRGTSAFVDETLYFASVTTLDALRAGDVAGAAKQITVARGRQGTAIVQLPVAALQGIPLAFGVPPSNPRSLLIPTTFNVIVSLVTLYLFFDLCVRLCGDALAAVAASVVYGLLVNTNLYVRHLLPYDWALAAGVYALWLGIARPRTAWLAAATGMLVAAVVTMYAGYYLLVIVLGVAIVGQSWREGWRRMARFSVPFAAGGASVIAAMELVCRVGGVSYIESSLVLSRTISMGSFEEGWTFLPDYLVQVERFSGVALLAGSGAALWLTGSRIRRGATTGIDWIILPAAAAWAWQAANSAELKNMVLYGRLVHPWLLLMALALANAIAAIERATVRRLVCAAVVALAVASWVPSAIAYAGLAYPPDVLYSLGIDTTRVPPERKLCELTPGTSYASPGPLDRATRYPYTSESDYLLINFCQGPPSGQRLSAVDTQHRALLYDGRHFLTFPAYEFEGFTPAQREEMEQTRYRVRAFGPGRVDVRLRQRRALSTSPRP